MFKRSEEKGKLHINTYLHDIKQSLNILKVSKECLKSNVALQSHIEVCKDYSCEQFYKNIQHYKNHLQKINKVENIKEIYFISIILSILSETFEIYDLLLRYHYKDLTHQEKQIIFAILSLHSSFYFWHYFFQCEDFFLRYIDDEKYGKGLTYLCVCNQNDEILFSSLDEIEVLNTLSNQGLFTMNIQDSDNFRHAEATNQIWHRFRVFLLVEMKPHFLPNPYISALLQLLMSLYLNRTYQKIPLTIFTAKHLAKICLLYGDPSSYHFLYFLKQKQLALR